jgi:hypothetical protein
MRIRRTLTAVAAVGGAALTVALTTGPAAPAAPTGAAGAAPAAVPSAAPTAAPRSSAVRAAGPAAPSVTVDAVRISAAAGKRHLASTSRGYAYLAPSIVAETPAGLRIWVSPRARHHWVMARYASRTATALRHLGLNVRYRGYGSPAGKEGIVRVREGRKGCGSNSSTVGMTWTYWDTLPSGAKYVTRADVYLCPRLFRLGTWASEATIGHELGHAMGLSHVPYLYRGSYQLMNPIVRPGVLTYRSGDKRGLRRLARGSSSIKAAIPPVGKLASAYDDGRIDFTGWALLKYQRTAAVTIRLTDNGKVVKTSGTPVLRSDVNRSYDPGSRRHGYALSVPWTGGTHKFCIRASEAAHPSVAAQLGCVTWRS